MEPKRRRGGIGLFMGFAVRLRVQQVGVGAGVEESVGVEANLRDIITWEKRWSEAEHEGSHDMDTCLEVVSKWGAEQDLGLEQVLESLGQLLSQYFQSLGLSQNILHNG